MPYFSKLIDRYFKKTDHGLSDVACRERPRDLLNKSISGDHSLLNEKSMHTDNKFGDPVDHEIDRQQTTTQFSAIY